MKKFLIAVFVVLLVVLTACSTGRVTSESYADKYIDLHLHLDGAVTVDIARELARIQGIDIPEDETALKSMLTVPEDCTSLNDFLKCFDFPLSLMQTEEGLTAAVRLVADNILSQGVIYAEIRFAPQLHTGQNMTQEDAIKAALRGLEQTKLKANLILCMMRGDNTEKANRETIELAKKYIVEDGGVVAVDLAGAEALFPTEDYRELFEEVKKAGLPFTIHAGEAAGAESVKAALEFGAKRIGHGVRSYEDPQVLAIIKEQGIVLEMCPTSNRQTYAVPDMSQYPFMDYLKQGIRVTLNTDDMGIEGTTLADEYRYMEKTFGLTAEQEKTLLRNSVYAAFTSQETKQWLIKELGL